MAITAHKLHTTLMSSAFLFNPVQMGKFGIRPLFNAYAQKTLFGTVTFACNAAVVKFIKRTAAVFVHRECFFKEIDAPRFQ
jgi:hypothetical protein